MSVLDSVSLTTQTVLAAVNTYFSTHKEGIVAVSLLCAAILTFAGRTLLRPTVFLLGFTPTFLVIAAFGMAVANEQADLHSARFVTIARAIALAIALLFALLVGSLVVGLLFRAATFFLCAAFGAVLVLLLNLFLLQPSISRDALITWYAAMLLSALATGVLSIRYPDACITLATSFDGAALAVFSLAHFLGHQPHLLSGAPNKSMDEYWAVSYAATTVLLGVLGASTQRNAVPIAALSGAAPGAAASQTASQDVEGQHSLSASNSNGLPASASVGASASAYANASTQSPTNRAASDYVDAAQSARLPFHKNLNSPAPFASAPQYLLPPSDEAAHLLPPDRPNTPPYAGSHDGAAGGPYGAVDDDLQYTVLPNLSAPPLGADGSVSGANAAGVAGPNGAGVSQAAGGPGQGPGPGLQKHAMSQLRP